MHGKDEPVLLPKGKTVVTEIMAKQEDEEELKYDDGMPMEDTVSMPAIGFGMGIVPEAVKSSQVSEPFKMDLPLKSSLAEEMPVAQDSETAQAMPQFLSEDVMSVPMPPAKQDSMGILWLTEFHHRITVYPSCSSTLLNLFHLAAASRDFPQP